MTDRDIKNMTNQPAKKDVANILPTERTQALNTLIRATQALVELSDKETQALAQSDMLSLNILQDEKEFLIARYQKLSQEFRDRLEDFRDADRGLLDRLEKMQLLLGEKAHGNNDTVIDIRDRSQRRTQSSLFAAQELAQQVPVRYNTSAPRVNGQDA